MKKTKLDNEGVGMSLPTYKQQIITLNAKIKALEKKNEKLVMDIDSLDKSRQYVLQCFHSGFDPMIETLLQLLHLNK